MELNKVELFLFTVGIIKSFNTVMCSIIFQDTSDHGNFFSRAPSGTSILQSPLWEMPIKSN